MTPGVGGFPGHGVMLGAFLAFYAFIGFEDMVNVAEEVENPRKAMPFAILMALVFATLLYALVSVTAVLLIAPDELAASHAPLAAVFERATGQNPVVISIIGMLSMINGVLVQLIMASRVAYGMANKGWLWQGFAALNRRHQTPVVATWVVMFLIWAFALWLPVEKLAAGTSYIVLLVFVLINASLITIEWREGRRLPVVVPVIGLLTCAGLLAYQISTIG